MQPVFIMLLIGFMLAVAVLTYLIVKKKETTATTPATTRPATTRPATTRPATTMPATPPATILVSLFESGCSFPEWNKKEEKLVDQNLIDAITPYLYSPATGSGLSVKPGPLAPKVGDSLFVLNGSILSDEANYTKVRAALKQVITPYGRSVIVIVSHTRSKTDSSEDLATFIFAPSSSIDLTIPSLPVPSIWLDKHVFKGSILALRSSEPTVIRPSCGILFDDVLSSRPSSSMSSSSSRPPG